MLGGKPLIEVVFRNALRFGFDDLVVATDDDRIAETVVLAGGKAAMTPSHLPSGTLRCAQVAQAIDCDVVVNIQGDEPFVKPDQVEALIRAFDHTETEIATLCYPLHGDSPLWEPSSVKVVKDKLGYALYFSRAPIPYARNLPKGVWTQHHIYYKHIGIYAFRRDVLLQLMHYPTGKLEAIEFLEQLTWMELGHRIRLVETDEGVISVDTPQDMARANDYLNQIQEQG
jgi:3-deoxy-manno-octulosonate cytidylyltransferase (CMP-KDO synthetase)